MKRKRKAKRKSLLQAAKAIERKRAAGQGFYDGRFRTKVIQDKKKEKGKRWARKKNNRQREDP